MTGTATPDITTIENRARISRTTAGIYKHHGVDAEAEHRLHRYARDVHSPAIARRAGIHTYRHFSFGDVLPQFLQPLGSVALSAPDGEQFTGAGHLDYLDERALAAFYAYRRRRTSARTSSPTSTCSAGRPAGPRPTAPPKATAARSST